MDLSGPWRACPADDELRRSGVGFDFDDSAWPAVPVPGHWRTVAEFSDADGPLLYRTAFHHSAPAESERAFVTLHGIFYQADVWLDGAYLGDPEGYFVPHSFDITSLARLGDDHVLAVEVTCAPQREPRARRNLTGAFQDPDMVAPAWNPGGLWRPVSIDITGPVRIDRCRVLCRDANTTRAHLRLTVSLDADAARTAKVQTLVDGAVVTEQDHPLARGMNELAWNFDIARPRLWWPWSMGEQPLTDVTVVVSVDGVESHRYELRTGLREIAFDDWVCSVNGERLFIKGVNVGPACLDIGTATDAQLRRDIELAREAGLDLVRLQAHVAPEPVYTAADELGMLVWQDLPLRGGYARSVRKQAVQQARAAVDLLGHHPSIALWCAHDTPEQSIAGNQLPTWNKTILDRWVKRALEHADESRPVIAASGVPPHLPQLDGTDSHLWFGWHRGDARDLVSFAAAMPRMVRFVSEFGAQSVPDDDDFPDRVADEAAWPDLDWQRLADRHGLHVAPMLRHVPPDEHTTFASWCTATQRYQASLLGHHIETLRRLKYRPTGGFCLSSLADGSPMVSTSLLDHRRRPKSAFGAVTDACRPVIVVADRLDAQVQVGAAMALEVHVVSDLHHRLDDVHCTATLRWPDGRHEWQWRGDVPADDCVRVGMVRFVVPDAPGSMCLDLAVEHGEEVATNRYDAIITR